MSPEGIVEGGGVGSPTDIGPSFTTSGQGVSLCSGQNHWGLMPRPHVLALLDPYQF